jgi:hypothetical protein
MPIPVELPAVEDEPTREMVVAAILESLPIEEVRQLIEEFEAEIRIRPTSPRHAPRSRHARCSRRPLPVR